MGTSFANFALCRRREEAAAAGEDIAQKGTAAWGELLEDYRIEMEKGTDPADPKLQALEKRRQALVDVFTGGDKGIEQNLTRLWTEQGDQLCLQYGMDPDVMAFLGKVAAASAKGCA